MKCAVCRNEFGDGENCQHCGADRVSGLGKYEGYTPKNSTNEKHALSSAPNVSEQLPASGYIICYKCAETIPKESVYCPRCGIRLIVECPKCGHVYSSQYPICNQCGTEREKYIAEQKRLAEQRAIEERRRQEAERLRLEEQRRKEQEAERLRLEEKRRKEQEAERLRQEEQRRKEEEAEREKIRRQQIINTEWYKEAHHYMLKFCAADRRTSRMVVFEILFFVFTNLCILTLGLLFIDRFQHLVGTTYAVVLIIGGEMIWLGVSAVWMISLANKHYRMKNRYIRKHDASFKFPMAREIVFHIIKHKNNINERSIQDLILDVYDEIQRQ